MVYRLAFGLLTACTALAIPHIHLSEHHARATANAPPVVANLFEWNWSSVANECGYLGQAGYTHVQVSTATEHIQGWQWWTSYQVVSHKIQSKRGSRDEFRSMVDRCHGAGVKVIVDVVFNHMAGQDSGTGVAGSSFSRYNYPGLFSGYDFHYCGTQWNEIKNWGDQWQIQNCQLSGLSDLKTESDYVRQILVNHGNDLISLGVDGFRIDAAKHIPIGDLNNIVSRLSKKLYITSEVIGLANPTPDTYASLGTVTASNYYERLKKAFVGGDGLSSLNGLEGTARLSSAAASVMVASHDSERNQWGLVAGAAGNAYYLAHVFMLAYPYGTPLVYSSYNYGSTDEGAPNGGYGTCSNGFQNGYRCEHRRTDVSQMIRFRAAASGKPLTDWQTSGANRVAFGRADAGSVIINYTSSQWSASVRTQVPAGTYCDALAGGKAGNGCRGASIKVQNGVATVNVPAWSAVAFSSKF